MSDFEALLVADNGQPARALSFVAKAEFESWIATQPAQVRALAVANRFKAKPGESLVIPGSGDEWGTVFGSSEQPFWDLAVAASRLPEGTYRLAEAGSEASALGWLLAHYRFDRYRSNPDPLVKRVLLTPSPAMTAATLALAEATAWVRDLVNTPAADLGPAELQHETERLAKANGASVHTIKGHDLESGYPMIHAVGQAADRKHAPRLIELEWGNPKHPRVAIVGKGVTFDSGGLDIKPAAGMKIMKKDMGGAAHALALARLVMGARLPVRLHLLIPAAENAIAGNAFRPGDILRARSGRTVEVDNTDAEGRLILADAFAKAGEASPELILDFATLTGAARVALGPELPALFCNDEPMAAGLIAAADEAHDPLWRLPLWRGYDEMLKSEAADTMNSGEGGMAGAITAALFLREFVPAGTAWAHLDTWAWRALSKPGRPKGGEALGLRAFWLYLQRRFAP